jgi:hypothetical protein
MTVQKRQDCVPPLRRSLLLLLRGLERQRAGVSGGYPLVCGDPGYV